MTEPLKQLYDPESVKKQAEPLIKIIDPLLEEEINRATQLLQQCLEAIAETGTKERDKTIPAISLFLHIIEISDGIRELLRQVCTDAAAPLLRALFESMLSLRVIVDKIDNPDVAMAWYVNSLIQRRTALEKADPVKKSRKKKARRSVAPTPTLDEKKMSKAINAELKRLNRRIDVDYKALATEDQEQEMVRPIRWRRKPRATCSQSTVQKRVHSLSDVERKNSLRPTQIFYSAAAKRVTRSFAGFVILRN